MHYDLAAIASLSKHLGFPCDVESSGRCARVTLRSQAVLSFRDAERDEDCRIEFEGTPWHFHDELMFVGRNGANAEIAPMDLLQLLAGGQVLIMEQWQDGKLADRSLIHAECNDEFKYLSPGEELRISRAVSGL